MEYVEGREIKDPLPLEQALKYAIQLAGALEAAHKKLITHRDLKPANILIAKSGIKVLDFGLANTEQSKATAASDDAETLARALTQKGSIVGTLQYMAPEQLQAKPTDVRADIFSFGCVLYEIVRQAGLRRHQHGQPDRGNSGTARPDAGRHSARSARLGAASVAWRKIRMIAGKQRRICEPSSNKLDKPA
jgi:serine/threonine protein kinase